MNFKNSAYTSRWFKLYRRFYFTRYQTIAINRECFNKEQKLKDDVNISSKITSLNLYLDENGAIKVGGMLEKCNFNNDCKHPVLMRRIVISQNWLSYGIIREQDILV